LMDVAVAAGVPEVVDHNERISTPCLGIAKSQLKKEKE